MKSVYLGILIVTILAAGVAADRPDEVQGSGVVIRSNPYLHSQYDSSSKLRWEDTVHCATQQLTWLEAINYCETLHLDAMDDWRLPNIFELSSIQVTFQNWGEGTQAYWSSTTLPFNTDLAAVRRFNPPADRSYLKNIELRKEREAYIRCVRGGL